MTDSGSAPDILGQVTDELLERYRRGEQPALTDYVGRYPALAGELRELFSALVLMENVRPGPPAAARVVAPARTGDDPIPHLGDYHIVREVGRGGMGIVYEAEQGSLSRRVALKVLHGDALQDSTHIERFQREARAAARLHHTNIVPVFGVGEENGTHYYVMQYIEGRPLDEVLAELRRLRAGADVRGGSPNHSALAAEAARSGRNAADEVGPPSSAAVAWSIWEGRFQAGGPQKPAVAVDHNAITLRGEVDRTPEPQTPSAASAVLGTASTSRLLSDPQRPFAKSVAHLGRQVAEALDYAARQGVLHRDVKPSNLLLDVWGSVWLTDFGLAKVSGTPDLTRTGDLLGTLRYLAPERFQGHADIRSDIYSLGLTLYEALALRPAFDDVVHLRLMQQITTSDPPRLDQLNPQLPRDLVTVVHKAMAKDPSDRYQTAGALAEDLGRFLDDRPIAARRLSVLEQAWRWCWRNPMLAGMLAALLALAFLATGGGVWLVQQHAERRAEAARQEQELRKEVGTALDQAVSFRNGFHFHKARELLEQASDRLAAAGPEDLRRQVDQAQADLDLVARLDAIRLKRVTGVEERFGHAYLSNAQADRDYEAAFREAGLGKVYDDAEVVTARIKATAVRGALVAALDDWAISVTNKDRRGWLLEVARSADPDADGWRDRVRDPLAWDVKAAVAELARTAPIAEESVHLLEALAQRLKATGGDAARFLRRLQREHPADFWANLTLGNALKYQGPGEAIGYYRVALAIRPDASGVYGNLCDVLILQGWLDEAIHYYRKVLRTDPMDARAQRGLGDVLNRMGRLDEATDYFQRAVRTDPKNVSAHYNLGKALKAQGQLDEAAEHFQQAITLEPGNAQAQNGLRSVLMRRGRGEEVRVAWQKALAANPPEHDAWFGYAELCLFLGHEEEYRRARRAMLARFGATSDPSVAERTGRACLLLPASDSELQQAVALINRALATEWRRRDWAYPYFLFAKGLADYRQGRLSGAMWVMKGEGAKVMGPAPRLVLAMAQHRHGQKEEARKTLAAAILAFDWRAAQADDRDAWICHVLRREAEALILPDLPAFLRGTYQPRDKDERLALLGVCQFNDLSRAAAHLYADALAADSKLAGNLQAGHRYNAACTAALAAAGQGADAANLGDGERARLRRQALEWLRADLAAWTNLMKDRPQEQTRAQQTLRHWKTDTALAGLRDAERLAALPPEEQEACRKLWAAVDALIMQAPKE
jgi:serine/threonine-protein kinase